ncbi:MAG: transcriptional repressor [Myxococcales bacterium FL481]|nr:MAG: transcriptional repressor [Myxococcales bacterium FL481]
MKVDDTEVDRRLERFKASAREAGLKLTHQRLEIFRAVASSLDHPNAEAVYRAVQSTTPTVSLDTVYRTLWLLTDLGLLTTLGPRQGSMRFDANVESHHHYVCTRCGLVRDFNSDDLDALKIPDTVRQFGQVASARVEIRGICDRCLKERLESQPTHAHQPPRSEKRSQS